MRRIPNEVLQKRILILDGAMGTAIQALNLQEEDFCGTQFVGHAVPLKGDYDLLNLTNPLIIRRIHQSYINAGADLISTNTFNSNAYSQKVYGMEGYVKELNFEGARLAREVADTCQGRTVWVAGSMGPTSKSLSLSGDFDTLATTYKMQAEHLIRGGADVILLETCFDVLNTKAALCAIELLNEELNTVIPVMVSATIDNQNGRTLTGQTLDAFYQSIAFYPILSFGINCSFGVDGLDSYIESLAQTLPCAISMHPNAGLPTATGEYIQSPALWAEQIQAIAKKGSLNIAGGCCGTTPSHIKALADALKGIKPHQPKIISM